MKVICRNITRKFLQCSFSIELFEILGWAVHIYIHTHTFMLRPVFLTFLCE
ncbi:hypothetical protein IC575_007775 [Cucumis melo]